MRRLIAVLAALGLVLAARRLAGARGGQAERQRQGAEGQRHQGPAARDQRLPRPSRADHARARSRSGAASQCSTRRRADGWAARPFPPAASSTSPRTSRTCASRTEHDHRRRRRPDRRQPSDLGALPRRADDRGAQRDRPRRVGCRQPRVRRGRRRAPAHAERRLPPGRRLPAATVSPGAVSSTSPRTCSTRATDETILPAYEIRKIDNAKIAFIGLTLEGTPDDRHAVRGRRPRLQTRSRPINALVREAAQRAGRAGVRRPAPPGRLPEPAGARPFRGAGESRRPTRTSTSASTSAGPRSRRSPNGLDPQVDVVVSAHTHAPYICTIGRASSSRARRRSAGWSPTSTS